MRVQATPRKVQLCNKKKAKLITSHCPHAWPYLLSMSTTLRYIKQYV